MVKYLPGNVVVYAGAHDSLCPAVVVVRAGSIVQRGYEE